MSKNEVREMIKSRMMPNGKTFENCSRIELYDMLMQAIQFINKQHNENIQREQKTLIYKIKRFFKIKPNATNNTK